MTRLLFCGCAVLGLCLVARASLSGLYLDNGFDQTMIHHTMTHHEKMVVEHEILDLLGLPARPRRSRSQPLNRSAPSFLLDVYKTLADERDQTRPTRSSEMSLTGEGLHVIDESDVIMTFQSKNHHGVGVRHDHGRRLWFDVSEVPSEEEVVAAELRVYKDAVHSSGEENELYTIIIQRIASVGSDGGLELEPVAESNTSSSSSGWLELNVTDTFIDWVEDSDTNFGFYITVQPILDPDKDIKPEDIGLVSAKGEEEKQPFLVAFFKSNALLSISNIKNGERRKREARIRKKDYGYSDNYNLRNNPFTDPSSHWTSRSCQIQTLYVSFKDLEWQDWIIAPDGYGAFYCSGECNFPLNAHMNATNHAIVQTLVHLLNPTQVPKPCCAPTKLTPISVLYFQDDSNVILKKYKNMVVKSCGCH